MKTLPSILSHGNLAIGYGNMQLIISEAKAVHIQATHLYVHKFPHTTILTNGEKLKQASLVMAGLINQYKLML